MRKKNFTKIIKTWSDYISENTFYLPVLGPVHCLSEKKDNLLFDILKNSSTNSFLDYDKNKRWFKEKPERIIISSINIIDKGLFLVSQNSFSKTINIYYYSNISHNEKTLANAWKLAEPNKKTSNNEIKFYCFIKPKFKLPFNTQNVYLKKITKGDQSSDEHSKIIFYENLSTEQKNTFSFLGNKEEHDGFNFLWQEYLKQKKLLNPIICVLKKSKIIGAIGPLDISVDAWGNLFLQPPFFGVLNNYKRIGAGKDLWSAAMRYASFKKAQYTLVQNTPNSPAAHFYKKQGLKIGCKVFSCLKKLLSAGLI